MSRFWMAVVWELSQVFGHCANSIWKDLARSIILYHREKIYVAFPSNIEQLILDRVEGYTNEDIIAFLSIIYLCVGCDVILYFHEDAN